MAEQLTITVGANVSQATQAMDALRKNIEGNVNILEKQSERLQRLMSLPNISFSQFTRLQKNYDKTQQQITRLNSSLASVSRPASDAGNALNNLSRIAQDAPFGFIGISNNINPMLESFQRLQKQSGSTGAALKAMVAGLTGPAGLGLAVGIASSLLVVFGDKLFKSGKAAKTSAEQLQEYIDKLNDIDRARVKGTQSAQEELVKLEQLYRATQNANIPLADRQRIVDNLQKRYPQWLGSIKDETILTGGAEDAYNKLTSAILRTARARAAQEELISIKREEIAQENRLIDALTEEDKLRRALSNFQKKNQLSGDIQGVQGINFKNLQIQNEVARVEGKIRKEAQKTSDIYKELNALRERSRRLAEQIQLDPVALLDVSEKEVKTRVKNLRDKVEKELRISFGVFRFELQPFIRPEYVGGNVVGKLRNAVLDEQLKRLREFEEETRNRAQSMADIISDTMTPAFQGMFDALFEGQNAVKGFFAGIAQGLRQMLARLTAALVQALALKAVFSLLLPGSSIAQVSIGKIFGGLLGFNKFAAGGLAYGPALGLVGEGRGTNRSNPEVIAPLDKLKDYLRGAAGGGQMSGEIVIRGKDLVYILEQNNISQGRRF